MQFFMLHISMIRVVPRHQSEVDHVSAFFIHGTSQVAYGRERARFRDSGVVRRLISKYRHN